MGKINYMIAPSFDEAVERMVKVCKSLNGMDFSSADSEIVASISKGKVSYIWIHRYWGKEYFRLAMDSKGLLSVFKWKGQWLSVEMNFANLGDFKAKGE